MAAPTVLPVAIAATAFVGTHFLLSHPLRTLLVGRLGERGFAILYSLVAAITLGWLVHAYRATSPSMPLWPVGEATWIAATIAMWVASVLFTGSLVGNPALAGAPVRAVPAGPRGVLAITRHPMMWAFAIWGAVHAAVFPDPANLVLTGATVVLALVGAALQDRKKQALQPDFWPQWRQQTSFVPFAALVAGRVGAGAARPGTAVLLGGTVLWLAATWAHLPLATMPAGVWRWIG